MRAAAILSTIVLVGCNGSAVVDQSPPIAAESPQLSAVQLKALSLAQPFVDKYSVELSDDGLQAMEATNSMGRFAQVLGVGRVAGSDPKRFEVAWVLTQFGDDVVWELGYVKIGDEYVERGSGGDSVR